MNKQPRNRKRKRREIKEYPMKIRRKEKQKKINK